MVQLGLLHFERTIDVIGGGRLRVRFHDADCRMLRNCEPGHMECNREQCITQRTVDLSDAMPPPTNLDQPGLGNEPNQGGQWLLVDVTNVQCDPRALACSGM